MLIKSSDIFNEIMEEVVEQKRRRKTRRGKKTRLVSVMENTGCSNEGNAYVANTISVRFHPFTKPCNSVHRKPFYRPTSPKAPHNSTQYLIEDSGNDLIDIEKLSPQYDTAVTTPFQAMEIDDFKDFEQISFYENDCGVKETYQPVNENETDTFIVQEFERDYQTEMDTHTRTIESQRTKELMKITKTELIQNLIKSQDILKIKCNKDAEQSRNDLKHKIEMLKQENLELIKENEELALYTN